VGSLWNIVPGVIGNVGRRGSFDARMGLRDFGMGSGS